MKLFNLVPIFLVALACGVTETGNPELVDVALQMRAATSDPGRVSIVGTPGVTGVTTTWLSLERVRFVRGAACDGPGEESFDIDGPWVVDGNSPLPQGITAELPADDYCRVRVRLGRASEVGGAPADLEGHVVLLSGIRADGVPFQIRSRREVDVDVRAASPFSLADATANLAVTMDVAVWLADVDLSSGVVSEGVLTIDDDNNDELLDAFEDAFEEALELFDNP